MSVQCRVQPCQGLQLQFWLWARLGLGAAGRAAGLQYRVLGANQWEINNIHRVCLNWKYWVLGVNLWDTTNIHIISLHLLYVVLGYCGPINY